MSGRENDTGGTETGNGSPTLSKVSGSGSWTSPKVTYGNNTSTSSKSVGKRERMRQNNEYKILIFSYLLFIFIFSFVFPIFLLIPINAFILLPVCYSNSVEIGRASCRERV